MTGVVLVLFRTEHDFEIKLKTTKHTRPFQLFVLVIGHVESEVGGLVRQAPPVTGKSFRVVPCVRTCVRAVLGLVRFQANRRSCPFPFPFRPGWPFPFPFYRAGFSLFPCASICSLFPCEHHEEMDSNEIKWIHMNSNEITWYQMKSHEFKWAKVN